MWASAAGRSPATERRELQSRRIDSVADLYGNGWTRYQNYKLETIAFHAGGKYGGGKWVWDGSTGGTPTDAGTLNAALIAGRIIDRDGLGWWYDDYHTMTPARFGAPVDGSSDDSAAMQVLASHMATKNGVVDLQNLNYIMENPVDFRVNYSSNEHFHVIAGDGAVLNFATTAEITGKALRVGANSQAQVDENSRFVTYGFTVKGPHTNAITDTDTPQTDITGISYEFALGLHTRDVAVKLFYEGFRAHTTFPIKAASISSDNCHIGLRLLDDCTLGDWEACQFKEGRFGIVAQPSAATESIYGQTFRRCNFEGNKVAGVFDPLSGSGVGIHSISIIEPHIENITYDGFRFGRAWTENNAATVGADRTRNLFNVDVKGGVWATSTAWGTAGHQPFVCHAADSGSAPAGLTVDIPVNLAACSVGYYRKSNIRNSMDVQIGATTEITESLPDLSKAWAPTLTFGGNAVGMTGSFSGTYQKIGKLVFFRGSFTLTAKGSSTGTAKIGGLPATTANTTSLNAGLGFYNNLASLTTIPWGSINNNATDINLKYAGSGGTVNMTEANFTDTSRMDFSGFYWSA